jgi:peptidoglycan glycosyltransferase
MQNAFRGLLLLAAAGLISWELFSNDGISDARWLGILGLAWLLLLLGTRIPLAPTLPTFNRTIIRTGLVLTTVFVIVTAQLVRIQIVEGDNIYHKTATAPDGEIIANPRTASGELDVARGRIYDRNGVVLADTQLVDGRYLRSYPEPASACVVGYYSPFLYGASGLELAYEKELAGAAGNNPIKRVLKSLLHRPQTGADLNLTLDASLQSQAMDLLGGSRGSVVVLDITTGEVVVMASNPTYDPNQLFTTTANDPEAKAYWQSLIDDPAAPLVTRGNLGLYTPGSTFKTVTAGIAIEEGIAEPDSVYEDNGQIEIDGRILVENNRPDEARDQWTLAEGIAWSLNVVLAQVGLQIGGTDLWKYGPRFGFGENIPFDLPVAESHLANGRDVLSDKNALADTAFGQGQIQVTPLHMAMIAAMWANDGTMMEPYLVDTVTDTDGTVTRQAQSEIWKTPVSPQTANDVELMMVGAVQNGSVSGAAVDGYVVGGKTGTAETGDGTNHSWFIGFIGDPEPRYAVAVVLEGGSGGLSSAVATGRDLLTGTIQARREDSP